MGDIYQTCHSISVDSTQSYPRDTAKERGKISSRISTSIWPHDDISFKRVTRTVSSDSRAGTGQVVPGSRQPLIKRTEQQLAW
jgi:hypothetical protein